MVDETVLKVVKRYLQTVNEQGIPVRYGVIFGSRASGYSREWSDIDLVVVSPRFDGKRKREDVSLLWRTAARVDSRIEPIAVGEKQFEKDDSSEIIEIARREGQKIAFAE